MTILHAKNISSQQTNANEAQTANPDPKLRIHQEAKNLNKLIKYIDERNFFEKHKDLLFDKGVLKLLLCSVFTDQELTEQIKNSIKEETTAWNTCSLPEEGNENQLVRLAEKKPVLVELEKKWSEHSTVVDEMFDLCERINTYLSSNKKTLLILEKTPSQFTEMSRFISVLDENQAEVQVKGPIKEPTGPFWKIKKNGKTVGYLLGSIHLTPNYMLNLNHRIRKAFDKAGCLAVEIDITNKKNQSKTKENHPWDEQYNQFSQEQTQNITALLKKLLPEEAKKVNFEEKDAVKNFIRVGVTTIQARIWKELEISSGIDLHLTQAAKNQEKPIEDLETEEQYAQQEKIYQRRSSFELEKGLFLKLLSSKDFQELDDPEEAMRFFVEQMSLNLKKNFQPLFDAWETGNLEALDISKSTEGKMVMTQRNLNMAQKIVQLVSKEKVFCCVGAAHTVGEISIQTFLNNFGFSTVRVLVYTERDSKFGF